MEGDTCPQRGDIVYCEPKDGGMEISFPWGLSAYRLNENGYLIPVVIGPGAGILTGGGQLFFGGELLQMYMKNYEPNGTNRKRNTRINLKGLAKQTKSIILPLQCYLSLRREVTNYLWVLNLNKKGDLLPLHFKT